MRIHMSYKDLKSFYMICEDIVSCLVYDFDDYVIVDNDDYDEVYYRLKEGIIDYIVYETAYGFKMNILGDYLYLLVSYTNDHNNDVQIRVSKENILS